ncbi:MAG: hypothetical protein HUK23_07255 [Sphaerochaetaceae bacterium]|nr:hypothetical protein [Sphaerochaetaceae bacterium]
MRRKFLLILFSFLFATSLFATNNALTNQTQGIPIVAYKEGYCIVGFTEIVSTGESDTKGMPFSITDSTIKYSSEDVRQGREIGSWSFASNESSITLSIEAYPLEHEEDPTVTLDYFMTFMLEYDYDVGENKKNVGYIITSSSNKKTILVGSGDGKVASSRLNEAGLTSAVTIQAVAPQPVISTDKGVRIMLADNYDVNNDDKFPYGNYEALVRITLQGGL